MESKNCQEVTSGCDLKEKKLQFTESLLAIKKWVRRFCRRGRTGDRRLEVDMAERPHGGYQCCAMTVLILAGAAFAKKMNLSTGILLTIS